MSDHEDVDDFAERVARPLRDSEQLDATFEARVMSAVHAAAREGRPAPAARGGSARAWRRGAVVRLSPLGALALAAGIVAIAMLSALAGWRAREAAPSLPSVAALAVSPETVHVVRFVFMDPKARAVALVGDFNGWSRSATPLAQQWREGLWSVSVTVPRGRHEYAFVVRRPEGDEWVIDPLAASVRDEFGTESSVVVVDGARGDARTDASS